MRSPLREPLTSKLTSGDETEETDDTETDMQIDIINSSTIKEI